MRGGASTTLEVNKKVTKTLYCRSVVLDGCCGAPVGAGVQRLHGGQREHGGGQVAPQRAVPVVVLPLRRCHAGAGELADRAWVVRVRP